MFYIYTPIISIQIYVQAYVYVIYLHMYMYIYICIHTLSIGALPKSLVPVCSGASLYKGAREIVSRSLPRDHVAPLFCSELAVSLPLEV